MTRRLHRTVGDQIWWWDHHSDSWKATNAGPVPAQTVINLNRCGYVAVHELRPPHDPPSWDEIRGVEKFSELLGGGRNR